MVITSVNADVSIYMMLTAFLISMGILLLHGATGVLIGFGVYNFELVKYFISSVLLYIPPMLFSDFAGVEKISFIQFALIPYGLLLYWYVTTRVMSRILVVRRKREMVKS